MTGFSPLTSAESPLDAGERELFLRSGGLPESFHARLSEGIESTEAAIAGGDRIVCDFQAWKRALSSLLRRTEDEIPESDSVFRSVPGREVLLRICSVTGQIRRQTEEGNRILLSAARAEEALRRGIAETGTALAKLYGYAELLRKTPASGASLPGARTETGEWISRTEKKNRDAVACLSRICAERDAFASLLHTRLPLFLTSFNGCADLEHDGKNCSLGGIRLLCGELRATLKSD